jgi:uncharacterized protein YjeT (DUF2065 family)
MLINALKFCILIQLLGGFLMIIFPKILSWQEISEPTSYMIRMAGLQAIMIGLFLYIFLKFAYEIRIMKWVYTAYISYNFFIGILLVIMSNRGVINGYFASITHFLMGLSLLIFYVKDVIYSKKGKIKSMKFKKIY